MNAVAPTIPPALVEECAPPLPADQAEETAERMHRMAVVVPVALCVGFALLGLGELALRGTVALSVANAWTTLSGIALGSLVAAAPVAVFLAVFLAPVQQLVRRFDRFVLPAFRAGTLFVYAGTAYWVAVRMVLPLLHLPHPRGTVYRAGYLAIAAAVALHALNRQARPLRVAASVHLGCMGALSWWLHLQAGHNIYQPRVYKVHILFGLVAFLLVSAGVTAALLRRPPSRRLGLTAIGGLALLVTAGAAWPARWSKSFGARHALENGSYVGRNAARILRPALTTDPLEELAARAQPASEATFASPFAAAGVPAIGDALAAAGAKNLLLVSIDTLRRDAIRPELPNFARLRRESVTFDRYIAAAPVTRWSLRAIVAGLELADWETASTLPEILQERGFATFHVSTFPALAADPLVRRGFDVVDESVLHLFNAPRSVGRTTDAFLRHLPQTGDRPFFGWIHYMDPHAPYDGAGWDDRSRYDDEVARVDAELGRLFAALERSGRLDDTLVVVVADHGEEFDDHGGAYHGQTLYDEIVRVPLFVRAPGGKVVATVESAVGTIDLGPTILRAMGVERPRRFAPRGADAFTADPARPMLTQVPTRQLSILLGRWKLIVHVRNGAAELYDVAADPAEQTNAIDARPDVAAALARRLAAAVHASGRSVPDPYAFLER